MLSCRGLAVLTGCFLLALPAVSTASVQDSAAEEPGPMTLSAGEPVEESAPPKQDVQAEAEEGESESEEPAGIAIAIMDVRFTGDVDPRRLEGVATLLVAEASRHPGVDVRSSADIRDVLGFEAERQLLGCEDDECLSELAGALGVDYLLTSEITRIGDVLALTLNLLDPSTGRAVARAGRRVHGEAELVDAADRALAEILTTLGVAKREPFLSSTPPRRSRLAWGLGGSGAGASICGGALLLSAWRTYWAAERDVESGGNGGPMVSMAEIDSARRVRAPLGVGLMVGGAALVAGAFILPRVMDADDRPVASLSITDDGAVASVTFSLR